MEYYLDKSCKALFSFIVRFRLVIVSNMTRTLLCARHCRRFFSSLSSVPQVAIVGSGPAGYYTAQHILKGHSSAQIDIYEKLPVPFGLVRFGIAPDHPEVKNVINTFTRISQDDRCQFLGNVSVGRDVTVAELRQSYSAVILAYGAMNDKVLSVPGEDLKNVLSARLFVGWYNGLPQDKNLDPDLDTDTAVVLGHGNVAIDVARILLTPIDDLRKTDITAYSLDRLSRSRVRRVFLVGRRGPLQVSFTPAELREMVNLKGCRPVFNERDFVNVQQQMNSIPRTRKRLTELMLKTAHSPPPTLSSESTGNEFHLKFLRSPLRILTSTSDPSKVGSIDFSINRLEDTPGINHKAIPTGQEERLSCGLVLRSIGYRSHPLDNTIPFDTSAGTLPNKLGRVVGHPGLYCSGWVKRGPVGVLATTMNDAFETGKVVVDDLNAGALPTSVNGRQAVIDKLKTLGKTHVSFADWGKIDAEEVQRGVAVGKPREKICDINEMLRIVEN